MSEEQRQDSLRAQCTSINRATAATEPMNNAGLTTERNTGQRRHQRGRNAQMPYGAPRPVEIANDGSTSARDTIQSCLRRIVDGQAVGMEFHELAEAAKYQKAFVRTMLGYTMFHCPTCKERWFCKTTPSPTRSPSGRYEPKCKQCVESLKKNGVFKFGRENDVDPGDVPETLPDLSVAEQLLIARAFPVTEVYRLRSGSHGMRGNVCTLPQDVTHLTRILPHRVADLPILIIKRRRNDPVEQYDEFEVNRAKVQKWLDFLMDNNDLYTEDNIRIAAENMDALPVNGNVASELRFMVDDDDELNQESGDGSGGAADTTGSAGDVGSCEGGVSSDEEASASDASDPSTGDVASPSTDGGRSRATSDSRPAGDEDDDYIDPANINLGPDQGGATGTDDPNDLTRTGILSVNSADKRTEEEAIRNNLFGTPINPVPWPTQGRPLNEYHTIYLQAMAFPTLFPYGVGDVTMKDRRTFVSLTDSAKHLIKYCQLRNGKYEYRFASHPRWLHWVHNICERHRSITQRNVFLQKNKEDADLTEDQLREIIDEGGDRLQTLLGKMCRYNANVTGTPSWFYQRKMELEALIEHKGMCTWWFTLSAADNHWFDLHRLINGDTPPPNFEDMDEYEKFAYRRKMAVANPHIVDAYFCKRVDDLLEAFFHKTGLELEWSWYRCEYQKRGTIHAHGCLRIKNDPGIAEHAHRVRQGRIAERILKATGNHDVRELRANEWATRHDTWVDKTDEDIASLHRDLTDEKIIQLRETAERGWESHNLIAQFHDFFLTTWHPDAPADAGSHNRRDKTNFDPKEARDTPHPCSEDPKTYQRVTDALRIANFAKLLNAVQRHIHNAYCLRSKQRKKSQAGVKPTAEENGGRQQPSQPSQQQEEAQEVQQQEQQQEQQQAQEGQPQQQQQQQGQPTRRQCGSRSSQPGDRGMVDAVGEALLQFCRFSFPLPLVGSKDDYSRTHVKIAEYVVGKGEKKRRKYQIEIVPNRNDRWLNSHSRAILEVWKANMDMQLILDPGKVADYMTKYVTKADVQLTKSTERLFKTTLERSVSEGRADPAQYTLKKMMSRLMGERELCQQETAHLILGIPMVQCSHSFVKINLENEVRRLIIPSPNDPTVLEALRQNREAQQELAAAARGDGEGNGTRDEVGDGDIGDDTGTNSVADNATDGAANVGVDGVIDGGVIAGGADAADGDDAAAGNTDNASDPEPKKATIMTVIDAYARRDDPEIWIDMPTFDSHRQSLETMSLSTFACTFRVLTNRSQHPNKIDVHRRVNYVPVFFPRLTSNPTSPKYNMYCKYALMKYRPWSGAMENAWGGDDASDKEIITEWQDFAMELERDGTPLPDILRQEIDSFRQHRREMERAGYADTDGTVVDNVLDTDGLDNGEDVDVHDPDDEAWMQLANDYGSQCVSDEVEPDVEAVLWDKEHDWSKTEYDWGDTDWDEVAARWDATVKAHQRDFKRKTVFRSDLNEKQKQAHDWFVQVCNQELGTSSTDGGDMLGRLLLLLGQGGSGKSHTVNSIITTLTRQYGFKEAQFPCFATTGKAAAILGGSTLHSWKTGFGLPVNQQVFRELKGKTLDKFQNRFKKVKAIIIDEFSMLSATDLHRIDSRLRQARPKCSDMAFGGFPILVLGDHGQLPPVAGSTLWNDSSVNGSADQKGHRAYKLFHSVVKLTENRRLNSKDPSSVRFNEFLDRLRDGVCTQDDYDFVRKHCSQHYFGFDEWERRGFNDPSTIRLFASNKAVANHNNKCLNGLKRSIALIKAVHSSNEARKASPADAYNLDKSIFLAVGARVLVTVNIFSEGGLNNGTTGVVKDLIYTGDNTAPNLPNVVIVEIDDYTGPSFFPQYPERSKWVPIKPFEGKFCTGTGGKIKQHSRTQLPLRLSWAWTIHKAQGQTFQGKVACDLGTGEPCHGSSYVAFSRVTSISNFGIEGGIQADRLLKAIGKAAGMQKRKEEERRLANLERQTRAKYAAFVRRNVGVATPKYTEAHARRVWEDEEFVAAILAVEAKMEAEAAAETGGAAAAAAAAVEVDLDVEVEEDDGEDEDQDEDEDVEVDEDEDQDEEEEDEDATVESEAASYNPWEHCDDDEAMEDVLVADVVNENDVDGNEVIDDYEDDVEMVDVTDAESDNKNEDNRTDAISIHSDDDDDDPMNANNTVELNLDGDDDAILQRYLYGDGDEDQVMGSIGTDPVTRASLQTLRPKTWLNDEVIHYYITTLAKRDDALSNAIPGRKRCHFFKSFFMTSLLHDGRYHYDNIRRWSNNVPGQDIFALDKLIVPINISQQHWTCAVIFMQEKRIQYYDSVLGDGLYYLRALRRYLKDEHRNRKHLALDTSSWTLVECQSDTPKQENGYDCGVFTCMFADYVSVDKPFDFNQATVTMCRHRMALSILRGRASND